MPLVDILLYQEKESEQEDLILMSNVAVKALERAVYAPRTPCTFPGFPVENPDTLDSLTLLWKKPIQCCLLAWLKKEHRNLAQIEVDKMLCFMCDIWTCSGINNGLFRRGSHDTDKNEEDWTDKLNYGRIGCLVWWVPFKSGETSLICSNLTEKNTTQTWTDIGKKTCDWELFVLDFL